jgi:ADP-ribose pyrophosphatase YjhB (NUDIX family)
MNQRQRVGAYALVRDAGRVLLCRMSATTRTPGRWTLPGGGLRHGEDPEDAVLRELAEETGLHGVVAGLVGVHSNTYRTGNGGSIHGVRLIYLVADIAGEMRAESAESTDGAAWLLTSDIPALDLSEHAQFALTELRSSSPPD